MHLATPVPEVSPSASESRRRPARVLVVGNEKGGSGKSTVAVHLVVGFLRAGLRVASLDLDVRQASLSRYLENRAAFAARSGANLPMPTHQRAADPTPAVAVSGLVQELAAGHDILIVDTPGRVDEVSMAAHVLADTIVTPVGESHLDLDLIGNVDRSEGRAVRPGPYAEFVWSVRKQRALIGGAPAKWIICHNRRRAPQTRVGREVEQTLTDMARRFAFRLVPGFSERTIFQELFPDGLTLLDLRESETGVGLTLSHVAARNEIRGLLDALENR